MKSQPADIRECRAGWFLEQVLSLVWWFGGLVVGGICEFCVLLCVWFLFLQFGFFFSDFESVCDCVCVYLIFWFSFLFGGGGGLATCDV